MPFKTTRSASKASSTFCAMSVSRLALVLTLGMALGSNVFAARQTKNDELPQVAASSCKLTLVADGQTKSFSTSVLTVGDMLTEQAIYLAPLDRCSAPLTTVLKDGMTVYIARIHTEVVTVDSVIPFTRKQSYTAALPVGDKDINQVDKNGQRTIKYICTYRDGTLTAKVKQSESVIPATPQIEVLGTRGMTLASRGYFGGRRIIEMVATGYGPGGNGRWGARTSSGLRPGFGVVAVDPHFIPLGTRLYIPGYGYAVAGDTGGAIKGNRIDLGHDTNAQAAAEGRKTVRVLVLN